MRSAKAGVHEAADLLLPSDAGGGGGALHVEPHDLHACIGEMGGDAGAHDPGAENGGLADLDHHAASSTRAMPWPPPMHWVASP